MKKLLIESRFNYNQSESFFKDNFEVGDFIKLKTWTEHKLKIVDIGSIYIIVEHPDKSLGWRYIDCDWVKA
jgi:hypothetical protein